MRMAFRFAAAAAALGVGWCIQMALYLGIASGSQHDIRLWALYSAAYCAFAMLTVGVPVVMSGSVYAFRHPVRSSVYSGAAGALIALVPPSGALFVLTVPLGFLVGAIAMWGYISLVSLVHAGETE